MCSACEYATTHFGELIGKPLQVGSRFEWRGVDAGLFAIFDVLLLCSVTQIMRPVRTAAIFHLLMHGAYFSVVFFLALRESDVMLVILAVVLCS